MAETYKTVEVKPHPSATNDTGMEDDPVGKDYESSLRDVDMTDTVLRRVPGPIPWILFLICVIEFGERFVYIGINGPLQNYIQHPFPHDSKGVPGALGRGQATGTALGDFLKFWSYLCTVFGAILADQYLGKFKTIINNVAFGGLVASMILIGLGTGGLKACIAPMCGEQSLEQSSKQIALKSGEIVIEDGKLTSARIFMWYYWAANIGALSSLVTVSVEKEHSFWLAYLIPLIVFLIVLTIFVSFSKNIVKVPARGSALVDAYKMLTIAAKEGSMDKAKPSSLDARNRIDRYAFARLPEYTDSYVGQIKSGLQACKYFILFPFYFLCWTQIFNNLVSQAGDMKLGGTPNDMMSNLETIFMLSFIPILDLLVYPALRKRKINFSPILRITMGFMCAALAMTYACVVQQFIYENGENTLNVWIQTPGYVFSALSEIWVIITGLEVAFIKAPENLRAVVSSIFWVTIAIGAALGIALSPVSQDPYMVWTYGALAIAVFTAGIVFAIWHHEEIKFRPEILSVEE
ncbi:hypothetical protein LTR17_011518 [Elasticomyces elasticus]|nr:hypothetical protein LTR17_011518 [Elasticomyces elasticus]